jgi:hypothetical protein
MTAGSGGNFGAAGGGARVVAASTATSGAGIGGMIKVQFTN